MCHHSQGIALPPRSSQHAHPQPSRRWKIPNHTTPVQMPRRTLHGAATYSSDESIRPGPDYMLLALAPTDGMAAPHSPGGCITPAPPDDMAATCPAGGRHTADDDDEDNVYLEFGITPLASTNAGHERPVRPTVMESFAAAITDLRPPRLGGARPLLHLARDFHATRPPSRCSSGGLSPQARRSCSPG